MKILIANQKGGVGKSTITTLLANYLVLEKKAHVIVFDLDFQDTVFARWERDKELYSNDPLYEVMKMDINEYPKYASGLDQIKNEAHLIMDLPGRLDDDNLLTIIKDADLIVCPIAYEQSIFESSWFFSKVARHVNPNVKIVFLPSRIKGSVKYEIENKVREALAEYGPIAPKVPDRVALERIDSFSISSDAKLIIQDSFDYIYTNFIYK